MTSIFKNEYFHITFNKKRGYNINYQSRFDFIIPYFIYHKLVVHNKSLENGYFNVCLKNVSITTLKKYITTNNEQLSYVDVNNLIINIGTQIRNIERDNMTVPFIEPNDIVVINDGSVSYFVYLGVNIIPIETINDVNNIVIRKPYKKSLFFSPEMLKITTLPTTILNNSWIYSIGILSIYCIIKNKNIERKNKNELLYSIRDIEDTKLYHCIDRCITKDPTKRLYLYV